MKYDWRLLVAALSIPSSFAMGFLYSMAIITRIVDWERNGDPCQRDRENGIHYGFCQPIAPEFEGYLGLAWIVFTVLAIGLVIWAMLKPQKPSHLQGRGLGEG